jgi:hypothetical protein
MSGCGFPFRAFPDTTASKFMGENISSTKLITLSGELEAGQQVFSQFELV